MKILIIILMIFNTMQTNNIDIVKANYSNLNSTEDIEIELGNTIDDLLNDLDLTEFDSTYIDEYKIFGNTTFKEKVIDLLNGEYFENYNSVFSAIFSLVLDGVSSLLPLFLIIIALSILSSLLNNFKANNKNNVSTLVNFVCMAVIVSILAINFKEIISKTSDCLNTMKIQMDTLFPIVLTLMSAIGGNISVGIYKPIVAILSSVISTIFQTVLLPMFALSFLFTIIGSISPNVKLEKLNSFISSVFKWVVGFIFTLFGAFLTVQGISAGKYDGVSIKASKFAIKSYVPIIGGYLSDGLDLIMLGSALIKNAIGVGGLIILFLTILSPLIQIVLLKLGLQLVSGIVETTNNKQLSGLINDCSKVLIFPIVLILGVAFMYILLIALTMCTINII